VELVAVATVGQAHLHRERLVVQEQPTQAVAAVVAA
jgi:hypothetical protein